MSVFRMFLLDVCLAYRGVFSFQNIVKDIFLAIIASKKKFEQWPFLNLNHLLTPFDKCKFFDFLNFCFYSPERRFFVLEYRKTHFPGLYWLKKKVGKMAFFGQKQWVNLLGKMAIFRLFELLVSVAEKGLFSFQNILKDIFLAYIA